MLEMLINPKKAERRPWEMFFVGVLYASLAMLLVEWIFSKDPVLSKYSGILLVTFTVIFSMPFMYYTIKLEEKRIISTKGTISLIKSHRNALFAFLWLFLGFVVAFSFWYVVLSSGQSFKAQVETYCAINRPGNIEDCVKQYNLDSKTSLTGSVTSKERLFLIFSNNLYVLIFTLLFSLLFGAGAIFILAWNASVIAAAIGIFAKFNASCLHAGLLRYLIHGLPEIASYFIVALAGGLVSFAVIRHESGTQRFWDVLHDSINLIVFAVIVLFAAALMEVYLTPILIQLFKVVNPGCF